MARYPINTTWSRIGFTAVIPALAMFLSPLANRVVGMRKSIGSLKRPKRSVSSTISDTSLNLGGLRKTKSYSF